MKPTIQIIAGNNQELLQKTLKSLPSDCPVNIIRSQEPNRSKIRNFHSVSYNFYLEPGETILSWQEPPGGLLFANILRGNVLSKEIRFWGQERFINPVYEAIRGVPEPSGVYISGVDVEFDVSQWQRQELLNPDPYYYSALQCLKRDDFSGFFRDADHFLFGSQDLIKKLLIHYYSAIIYAMQEELSLAVSNIAYCLSQNILLAECWCLLGDIYLKTTESWKAIQFYQNALLLGKFRQENDLYPVFISKYSSYPMEMLGKITHQASVQVN